MNYNLNLMSKIFEMIDEKYKENRGYLNYHKGDLLGDEELKYLLSKDISQITQLALGTLYFKKIGTGLRRWASDI